MYRLPVSLADGVGDDHVGAQCDADEQVDHQTYDGAVSAHRRHGHRAGVAGEVAHHRNI